MDPITASILISGGINALQGKRGSDLLKSTISDAALAYATGGGSEATEGISTLEGIDDLSQVGINQYANANVAQQMANTALQGETFATRDAMNAGDFMQFSDSVQNVTQPTFVQRAGQVFDQGSQAVNKGLDFFRKTDAAGKVLPGREYDKGKVLLGAGALGAGLYAAGAFKPTPAPQPKYPGFNRFYAADPGMFQPFSGRYGPDTSKYPEGSPYSGMQEGGIASPDDSMSQSAMAMNFSSTPLSNLYAMAQDRFMPQVQEPTQMTPMNLESISENLPEALKRKYIIDYKSEPNKTAVRFAQEMKDSDRLSIGDIDKAKKILEKLSSNVQMPISDLKGILGLVGESDVSVPKAPDTPEYVQRLIELIQARSVNEPPKAFAAGDIIDVLPSKLKRNENDEMNYKRTSGKLVIDETGKGSGNKDTMLAQLADGEFVTKSKSVLGAGKMLGGKSKEEQRNLGAQFFYKQMAELEKFA